MSARNLVDLLSRHSAGELDSLRKLYPAAADLLRWDRDLGDDATPANTDIAPRRALAEAGIAAMQRRGEVIVHVLSARLRRAQQFKIWGAVLAALANAGLLASLNRIINLGAAAGQTILAAIAFAASISALLAERAGGARITQLFDDALGISLRTMRCEQKSQRLQTFTAAASADWDALLADLDAIALDLFVVELKAKAA